MKYIKYKTETFNICLNSHRSDLFSSNAISACCHFAQDGHSFSIHAKFLLIETITDKR